MLIIRVIELLVTTSSLSKYDFLDDNLIMKI